MLADKKPTASNDNSSARRTYKSTDQNYRVKLFKYIPTARSLIKRYSKRPWKHSIEHSSYAFLEYQLCTLLETIERTPSFRKWDIRHMATVLEVNPVKMLNDPNLPF